MELESDAFVERTFSCYLHLKKTPLLGDIEIAGLEAKALGLSGVTRVETADQFREILNRNHVRSTAVNSDYARFLDNGFGFSCHASEDGISRLARRSAFFREILVFLGEGGQSRLELHHLPRKFRKRAVLEMPGSGGRIVRVVPASVYFELSELLGRSTHTDLRDGLDALLNYVESGFNEARLTEDMRRRALPTKMNDYASHSFHLYKARFFPRFARSVINICLGSSEGTVLDPFVGSGTSLIESSLMGLDSTGVDIDPLSAFISRVKAESLSWDLDAISHLADLRGKISADLLPTQAPREQVRMTSFSGGSLQGAQLATLIPSYIEKRLDETTKESIKSAILSIRASIISHADTAGAKDFFMLMLSDSLARKFRLRFHGLGFGRFSIESNRSELTRLFIRQSERATSLLLAYRLVGDSLGVDIWSAQHVPRVFGADYLGANLPTHNCVVTSPPYLPAASGRESYLRSKGPSLLSLSLISHEDEIWSLEERFIGSLQGNKPRVLREEELRDSNLPESASSLVRFLMRDKDRNVKAYPTYQYFIKMKSAFVKTASLIQPDGSAAFIVSTFTTFYRYSTRETLRRVDVASILGELAEATGLLKLQRRLDVPLAKSFGPARPRSRDEYSESLLIFKRISEKHF